MTATRNGSVATYEIYGGGSESVDFGSALPSSLTAFGHTITAQSDSTASISGPVIATGSASLVNATTSATTAGTYKGTTESKTFTPPHLGGGGNCAPRCPLIQPELTGGQIGGAIFSGIGFVAGIVGLVLFLPEMAILAMVLAVIDVLASLAGLCWSLMF